MPLAITLNVLLPPVHIEASCGLVVIAGNELTVSVAALDIPGVVHVGLDNWQRYL